MILLKLAGDLRQQRLSNPLMKVPVTLSDSSMLGAISGIRRLRLLIVPQRR
jgi:hypothetical protein